MTTQTTAGAPAALRAGRRLRVVEDRAGVDLAAAEAVDGDLGRAGREVEPVERDGVGVDRPARRGIARHRDRHTAGRA